MCTAMPMTSAGPLNVPSSGAARQNVCAIRFSGVQNPLPASHSIIIEKTAITAPPAIPAAIPARTTLASIALPPPFWRRRHISAPAGNGNRLSGN